MGKNGIKNKKKYTKIKKGIEIQLIICYNYQNLKTKEQKPYEEEKKMVRDD